MTEQIELLPEEKKIKIPAKRKKATPAPTPQPIDLSNASGMVAVMERVMTDPACDPEKLKVFLDGVERIQAGQDHAAFNAAMAKIQAECPDAVKNTKSDTGRYAKTSQLTRILKPLLGQHGIRISMSQGDGAAEGMVRHIAVISYGRHEETHYKDLPPDSVGFRGNANKTMIHALKSSSTYAQGILLAQIFNVTLADADDDGNAAGGKSATYITPSQAKALAKLAEQSGVPSAVILKFGGVESFETFPVSKHAEAVKTCRAHIRQKGGKS
ncbi:MAG: hypothetical protein GY820_39940 [Gammaproteobacteria bacterium]|nr:hypothetical protein [Gammaproteobacteria bacterium]